MIGRLSVLCSGQHSGDGKDLLDSWPQVQQERSWRSSENGTGTGLYLTSFI